MIISFEEKYVLQKEDLEFLETLHSELFQFLGQKSQEYQKQFPFIDSSFRINLEHLQKNKLFDQKIISQDLQIISEREKEFLHQQQSLEGKINALKGEIIEIVKTTFQEDFFNNQFIVFRASKFDDYVNGIDQIIFDKKTLNPLAAVDITSDIYKKNSQTILRKLQQGATIKYIPLITQRANLYITNEFRSQENVPMIYLIFDPKKIIELATSLTQNDNEKKNNLIKILQQDLKDSLTHEINNILNLPITEERKQIYKTLLETLQSI